MLHQGFDSRGQGATTLPAVFSFSGLLWLLLIAGCSDSESARSDDTLAAMDGAGAADTLAQEGAMVSLVAPAFASHGEPVLIKLQVRNETAAPLDLYLMGREVTFDIAISDATGDAVWSRLSGEVTPAVLQLRTLAPGEVMELTHSWDQKSQRGAQVQPGRYAIRGSVLTDGRTTLESNPASLEVTPD